MEHSQVGNGRMCEDSHIIVASINIVFDNDNIWISHHALPEALHGILNTPGVLDFEIKVAKGLLFWSCVSRR